MKTADNNTRLKLSKRNKFILETLNEACLSVENMFFTRIGTIPAEHCLPAHLIFLNHGSLIAP
jgi:hypothetical protein